MQRSGFNLRASAGWILTALALGIWFLVHGDYGMTCDESVQSAYGEAVRNYIFGHGTYADFLHTPNVPENIFFYGPALDLFCATLAHLFNADIFSIRHGVQGLLWVAMFYPVCALGRRLAGKRGAWFAGLALLGMPSLFGQAFNNPKDLPLACAAVWLAYTCAAVATGRRMSRGAAVKLGCALGFLLAMRPGAWFLGVLLGLVPLAALWHGYKITGRWRAGKVWQTLPGLLLAGGLGWLLMILPWPSAWHSPVGHPLKSAIFAMHFQEVYLVLLRGTLYPSNHLPPDYLASYLVLTLPLPLLGLLAWAQVVLWRKGAGTAARAAAVLGVGFLIWFPLVVFLVLRPNIYDGMRHFLFMLPAVAVLAGVGAADVAGRLRRFPARLHPYENVYFNWLAGPKATLSEHFETDYWFSSYREAAGWINEAQGRSDRPLRVLVAGVHFYEPVFTHYAGKKTTVVMAGIADFSKGELAPDYDYYVGTERYGQWLNFSNDPVVYQIAPGGVTLAVIRGQTRK